MKLKRLLLLLVLLLGIAAVASASVGSLDEALAPLMENKGTVHFFASLQLRTLLPFDETRIDLLNRVLKHARLDVQMNRSADEETTAFQLTLGNATLMEMTEQNQGGAYLLQTSLLQNRMLFSTQASPMDTLLAASDEEPAADEALETTLNDSDVETAFDFPTALRELEGCYQALLDQTVPLTKKNTPNYSIEHIGRGRISYVAKLTTEQSGAMLAELRAVLSCGMDAVYREEIAGMTFSGGFTVALYQNEDAEDICLYIKGTVMYPDGDRRSLKWQWAFTPDRSTQTFTLEAARESGTRDSRVINAILTRTEDDGSYTLKEETEINLRRSSLNETSTLTTDLRFATGEVIACKGEIARVTKAIKSGESAGNADMRVTVDLALADMGAGAELSGTAVYAMEKNGKEQMELELTFIQTASAVAADAQSAENAEIYAPGVEISIIPADPAVAEQIAQTPTSVAEDIQAEQPEFLVGTPPAGLYDYEAPAGTVTINMDSTQRKVHQSLMNEAAQQLAGNLVLAMLDLPMEDKALLADGMTDEDYSIFLAMLD